MRRAALLLFVACSHKATPPPPPDCTQACAHVVDLMRAHLEDSITRGADHSTPASADHLRATFDDNAAAALSQCEARCDDHDAACLLAATSVDEAADCTPTDRP
jgi:hypothetical protein